MEDKRVYRFIVMSFVAQRRKEDSKETDGGIDLLYYITSTAASRWHNIDPIRNQ
jgi:hypothetical protein